MRDTEKEENEKNVESERYLSRHAIMEFKIK